MAVTGHIERRGDAWLVVVEFPRDKSEPRKRYSRTVRGTRKDAQEELQRLMREMSPMAGVPSREHLSEYLAYWHKTMCVPFSAPTTAETYHALLRNLVIPRIGPIRLRDLRPMHVQSLYSELVQESYAPMTVRMVHGILHKALEQAVIWGLIPSNPADHIKVPRIERKSPQVLTVEECKQLLDSLRGHPYYALVYVMLYTGMRRGEALALRWSDVDYGHRTVVVDESVRKVGNEVSFGPPKTRTSRRSVTVSEDVLAVLKAEKRRQNAARLAAGAAWADLDLVFADETGHPLDPDRVSQWFRSFAAKLGFGDLHIHCLRHTHASLLLALNVHPKTVQERLGHSTIVSTMDTYSHVAMNLQQEAAELFSSSLGAQGERRAKKGAAGGDAS